MIRLLSDESTECGAVLRFSGEIDAHSVSGLRALLLAKASVQCPTLVLDFTHVTFVCSGGLAVLVEYWREAQTFCGFFAVAGLNPHLAQVFEIVHLSEQVHVFDTVPDALLACHGNRRPRSTTDVVRGDGETPEVRLAG